MAERAGQPLNTASLQRELHIRDRVQRRAIASKRPAATNVADDTAPTSRAAHLTKPSIAAEATEVVAAAGGGHESVYKEQLSQRERQRMAHAEAARERELARKAEAEAARVARAVREAVRSERERQSAAEAEAAREYWPVRVREQKRRGGAARAGAHPPSLLVETERVHGPSKGLPIWNAGTLSYEPYGLASAALEERPNFNVQERRARGEQPFRVNYPMPPRGRPAPAPAARRAGLTAETLREATEQEPQQPEQRAAPGEQPAAAVAASAVTRPAVGAPGGAGGPPSPQSVGPPSILDPADAPPAYLAGRMAYSTNRRAQSARAARPAAPAVALRARPPVAGAIAPRASPPDTAFRRAKDGGDVPLQLVQAARGTPVVWTRTPAEIDRRHALALAWDEYAADEAGAFGRKDGGRPPPPGARAPPPRYTCAQLLVLCCGGVRELEPTYQLLAAHGASELIAHLSGPPSPLGILPVVPHLVPPLKEALSTRQPAVVAIVLRLLQQLVCCHARAGRALLPGLPSLLPLIALFVGSDLRAGEGGALPARRGAAREGEMEWAQGRRVNLGVLANELLEMVASRCEPDGARLVRSYVPTWGTAADGGRAHVRNKRGGVAGFAQRGFDAPGRGARTARTARPLEQG